MTRIYGRSLVVNASSQLYRTANALSARRSGLAPLSIYHFIAVVGVWDEANQCEIDALLCQSSERQHKAITLNRTDSCTQSLIWGYPLARRCARRLTRRPLPRQP